MRRHLCLWFPNWPIQRRKVARSELLERPLVLSGSRHGREVVEACCRRAARCGVHPGLPLAEAQTLLAGEGTEGTVVGQNGSSGVVVEPDNPEQDRKHLRRLAWDCEEFSPLVGLEEGDRPASLLLEVTGCAACFGGEEQLARRLRAAMAQRGFRPRVALADTIGAAWGVAHYARTKRTVVLVPPGEQREALHKLPVEALRLSTAAVRKLHTLDLRQVGQLLALPRKSLPSRFGRELLQRIDQALGDAPELIVPERRPEPLIETWESEAPIPAAQAVEVVAPLLIDRIVAQMSHRREGAVRLNCRLHPEEGRAETLQLRLMRPTTDARHLRELLQLQCERTALPEEVIHVSLEVVEARLLAMQERSLWESDGGRTNRDVLTLTERLSSRLGAEAVTRPVLCPEYQPELSFRYESAVCLSPVVDAGSFGHEATLAVDSLHCLTRPLWLMRQPTPIEVTSVIPDGPPHRLSGEGVHCDIAHTWGPERITTGWWRGEQVRRDYYQVELVDGRRLWLFRDWKQRRWFLHAALD